MIKLLIIFLVVVGVAFIAYDQGTKQTSPLTTTDTEVPATIDTTKETPTTSSEPTTNTTSATPEPSVTSGQVIDLHGTGLTQTPKYVFEKTATEILDLSNNKLTGALQAEIRHLQNLKVLNLSNNQFTGVPAEIGQLKNLEVLDLSNNLITGLPLELGNLSNLKVLKLQGNKYSSYDLDIITSNLPAAIVVEVD